MIAEDWSWSRVAFLFCIMWMAGLGFYLAAIIVQARPKRNRRLPRPHHTTDRNKTEAVP